VRAMCELNDSGGTGMALRMTGMPFLHAFNIVQQSSSVVWEFRARKERRRQPPASAPCLDCHLTT
jgi:hypothetical protein